MSFLFRLLILAALSFLTNAYAQTAEYPAKPIRLVIPFPPGGTTDILGRLMGEPLNQSWRVPIVYDNRAGAGGLVGAEYVAKAVPDGYTVLVYTIAMTTWPTIHKHLAFDPLRDFAPLVNITLIPSLMVIHPSLPVRNVKQLVALARSRPDELNYATTGSGTSPHLFMEMFKSATRTRIVHVPYKGASPALVDLIGGHIQLGFTTALPVVPHIKQGKLVALAVSTKERFPLLPDAPTLHESGIKDFDASSWVGLVTRRGTPPDIVAKLSGALRAIRDRPDIRERIVGLGGLPAQGGAEDFERFIAAEAKKWSAVAAAAKLGSE